MKGLCGMSKKSIALGALTGGLFTAPMMSVMYIADKWVDLSFAPFDAFDWLTRVLPGAFITFGIDLMIDLLRAFGASVANTAKTAEQIIAVGVFLIAGAVAGIIVFVAFDRLRPNRWIEFGLILGVIFGVPIAAITADIGQSTLSPYVNFAWITLLFLAWGALVIHTGRRTLPPASTPALETGSSGETRSAQALGRRQFLVRMGVATASVTVVGAGLGRVLETSERSRLEKELDAVSADAMTDLAPMIDLPNEDDPVKPALGTRPEYTAVRDHYKVFIRSQPTKIEAAAWTLPIAGLVDHPKVMTLDEIRTAYAPRSEFVTLTCISNRLGGDLISTTYWTGVSMQDILEEIGPKPEARYLVISCGDGFYETVALDLIYSDERIMLAYAWDGRPIPFDHGFPLRIWLPDRYGMKQPKWITGIEVVGEYREGYWVERGWDEVARIKATSVVDTVAVDSIIEDGDSKLIPVGGIAFAGARGVSKVEVRVDEKGEWREAKLRSPLSDVSWVIWRYDWPFSEGSHVFEVRCVESDGTPQIAERSSSPRPSGSTGIHQRSERV